MAGNDLIIEQNAQFLEFDGRAGMLTKIATHDKPEWYDFCTEEEELDYWRDICGLCNNRTCTRACSFSVIHNLPCNGCEASGIVAFLHDDGDEFYTIVTNCGYCNGLGII
jgi:hypothetical protein